MSESKSQKGGRTLASTKGVTEWTIRAEKLRKEFDGIVAVNDLDLKIGRGLLYGMIGPNGSGKTTTIKMLVGLLRSTSGNAWVLGEKIPARNNIARLGYMPQEMAIYSDLTIHENIELFGELYSMGKEALGKSERELLKMVDLYDRRDSLVSTLSGGMKHRVSLACALVHDPEVVFLDEPTVGVDPELRVGFWKYFSELRTKGKTIVLTTHYMDEAVRCDAVGMMRTGDLIAEGSPRSLMEATKTSDLESAFLAYARRSVT